MKNIFNNIFGISQRGIGKLEDDGTITIQEILSYDLVANTGFSGASFDDINDLHNRILEELKRQKLLEDRKDKINRLNNL